ncbi:hypothetical protein ACIA5D_35760 [Actinoplanes sp. NPDC051513]|uniref:hypothetical protein n=1 Tax=Actinoplanes sp. NPDC051513 TaxID=3363908 RepID=UPI00378A5B76
MTPTLEQLEQRLNALEERMGERTGFDAGQDRDLRSMASALSSQNHVLEALAISELQHTESLAALKREMRELRGETRQIVGMLIARDERR